MAEALKVLGQRNPAAATLEDMYTVPALTTVTVSSLTIANRTAGNINARVSVAVAGAADSLEQYLIYDLKILKNSSEFYTLGITLGAADVVRVYSTTVGLSFNLFGVEVT